MPEPSQIPLPRAILFDHDGVLAHSEPLHWAAWRELLRELGLPFIESEIRAMVGLTAPQIMTSVLEKYGDTHRPGWRSEGLDVNVLAQRKNDHYLEAAETQLRTYPGVPELLKWLRQNDIRAAVVSNARRRELENALTWLGIREWFEVVISRDDARASKPDPTPYLLAAAELGLELAECLAVEDSPAGIEAALVGGVPSAAVLTNFPREVMQSPVPGRPDLRPVWVGQSIEELHAELRRALRQLPEHVFPSSHH